MDKKNYISPAGYQKLVDEFNQLLRVERPEVTKLVQWAASNGDRSENADYLYGKRRLREIDRRVRFLSQRIESSQVVHSAGQALSQIQFGATVRLCDEEGEGRTFTIVGVDEVDTSKGKISWQSPIGRSLLGKKIHDAVTTAIPSGEVTYEIISITYLEIQT